MGRIENLKNKFQSLVKKNKEFANLLDELEAKKDKIEQKNAGFSKIIDEVFFFKIYYLFICKSTIRFFYFRKKPFSRKKKAL